MSSHENLDRDDKVTSGSDRAFGLVFAVVFLLIALWPLTGGSQPRLWSLAVAAGLAGIAAVAPGLLAPMNRLWFRFGMLLHKVMTPTILFLIYVTTVVPTGLIMRLVGKDPLRRRFEPDASTYWIARDDAGVTPASLRRQF